MLGFMKSIDTDSEERVWKPLGAGQRWVRHSADDNGGEDGEGVRKSESCQKEIG